MRYTDIAVVGGGLAGSTAAAMLGRAGVPAVLIDPHPTYPPELRCEKLGGDQLDLLRKTGLAEPTLRATTLDGEVWEARFGYVVAKKPSDQHGIMYDTLVNTMRALIPAEVETIFAKASGISNSDDRQLVTLSNGEQVSARLVVIANGLNIGLRTMLGIERQVISPCHSITLGFDVAPVGRAAFDFPALTYWPKRSSSRRSIRRKRMRSRPIVRARRSPLARDAGKSETATTSFPWLAAYIAKAPLPVPASSVATSPGRASRRSQSQRSNAHGSPYRRTARQPRTPIMGSRSPTRLIRSSAIRPVR